MSTTESTLHQMPRKFEAMTIRSGGDFAREYPDVLTIPEVARILRVGKSTVYELANHVDFPAVKIGRRVVVQKAALAEWVRKQTNKSQES